MEIKAIENEKKEMIRKSERQEEGSARSYEDFLRIARDRGHKKGWAYHRAKARGFI